MSKRLDYFKLASAFMVVAIHTAPFSGLGDRADFLLTYCLFRVAVPFFLMVSGYFVMAEVWDGKQERGDKYLSGLVLLYLLATVLYLPVNLYAGKEITGVAQLLRIVFFEGTFYHLWYLPAAIIGFLLVKFLYWALGAKGSGLFVLILYIVGTLGDSYCGLVCDTTIGAHFYQEIFAISQYTRNGIFYAPVFLWLGAAVRKEQRERAADGEKPDNHEKRMNYMGLFTALFLLMLEGMWTYEKGWQKHNSMYFMLLPVMYFLFRLLIRGGEQKGQEKHPKLLRNLSMWIYILHPLCIVLVRGGAKVVGLKGLLVENALLHFGAVCLLSAALALGISMISFRKEVKHGRKEQSLDRTEQRESVS